MDHEGLAKQPAATAALIVDHGGRPRWLCWEAAEKSIATPIYHRPLLWLALAVIAGVKWNWLQRLDLSTLFVGLIAALLLAFALQRRGQTIAAGCVAVLAAITFGGGYARLTAPAERDSLSAIATRKAEPIALRGLIASAAVWKPNPNHREGDPQSQVWQTQWSLRGESLRDGRQWKPIDALCILTVDGRIDDLLPGDAVEVMGSFRKIALPTNPGGFDFARHFQLESKFVTIRAKTRSQISLLQRTWTFPLQRVRAWLVQQVDQSLRDNVAFSQSPLAAALVFGQREQVDWEDQQELMATGTLHMLAISGMHVEIVAAAILLIALPLGWRHSTLLVVIVCVCGAYAALAGGKPPVLRAVIVVAAFALARVVGRPGRLSNVLGLAALVLVLTRAANVDNVGVQLSFLAVGTIGVFVLDAPPNSRRRSALQAVVEESLGRWRRWSLFWWRSLAQTSKLSLWVWLLTCPLVWTNFHIVAPIAIPLNVLIALPLAVSLVCGLITGLLGWLPGVGWLSGGICGLGLSLIDTLVTAAKHVPLGHLWLPAPPLWWMIGFYLWVAGWLAVFGQSRNRLLASALFGWLLLAMSPHVFGPRGWCKTESFSDRSGFGAVDLSEELRCTFLDVGHGTSVIIEMPNQEVWLYDAGHLGAAERSHQEIAAALWQLPTARIDKLVISHADSDHYNATRGLLERFRIETLASTAQFWSSTDRHVSQLLSALGSATTRQEYSTGTMGEVGAVHFQVLHPRRNAAHESDNASSLCLLLEYAGKRILLPGDLEGSGLLALTQLPPRPCHVLMAPHHGSLTLDPRDMLEWCRPEWVVISGNHRATRPEVIDKYASGDTQLGITFRDGAIQFRVDRSGNLSAWHWQATAWQQYP